MSLEKSIFIDSIIFIVVNLYIIIWVLRKKMNIKEKLSYILFFIILNSSYNIMIKPIHDYNTVIPRTFIWRYKVFGSFSVMDIFFIIFFILFIKNNIHLFIKNKLIRLLYYREFIIIIIGSIMFFYNKGYWLDNGSNYILNMKGIVYFFSSVVLVYKYIRRSINEVNYINIFCLILLSGMLSTFFIDNTYLWVRYGNAIKIIDQEDAYGISMIVIFYFFFTFKEKVNFKNTIVFFIMLLQNLLCMYKANLINFIISMLLAYILFSRKNIKAFAGIYVAQLTIISGIIIKWNQIQEIITSKAIITRIMQGMDFLTQMIKNGVISILFGLGIGTPYVSNFNIDDGGEIQLIDKDTLGTGYRNSVQIPNIGIIKSVGLLGWGMIMLVSVYTVVYLKHIISMNKSKISNEFKALTIMLIILLFTATTEIAVTGAAPSAIIAAFTLSRVVLEIQKINLGEK